MMIKKVTALFLLVFLAAVLSLQADDRTQENPAPEAVAAAYPPHAIMLATVKGDVDMMKKIIATNPDRDVRDSTGRTALHDAMFQRNSDVIKLLIASGWDLNAICPRNGHTPLHDAVMTNNAEGIKLLLAAGADKNIRDNNGDKPLDMAAKAGKRDAVLAFRSRKKAK